MADPDVGDPGVADRVPHWPQPLKSGDLVVVVAPGGPADPDRIRAGSAVLESWGLSVVLAPSALARGHRLPYLAADDATRTAEIMAAWTDPRTTAVWAARGGYGTQRIVDLLDWPRLRAASPRHFVGFSDVTALHTRIGRELGQVTIHGPNVGSADQLADAASGRQLRSLLSSPPAAGTVLVRGTTLTPGTAEGTLRGGNVSLLAADVGVEPVPPGPRIALLEEVGEPAYRVDRMLTQLVRGGWLARATGVVVGEVTGPDPAELVERVVADRLGALGVPVLVGAPVGHGNRNFAVPLGAAVRLTAGVDGSATLVLS